MIVIFSQDGTWVHNDAEEAKARLLEIYGEKLGQMAYDTSTLTFMRITILSAAEMGIVRCYGM